MIAKSKAYHEKKHIARAQHKAEKRHATKSQHRNVETPRSQRVRGNTPAMLGNFAPSIVHKFAASLFRGEKVA